jgi:hypothetical protein
MAELSKIQRRQEAAKKLKADMAARTGNIDRPEKIPDGRSRWRILPSWRGEEHDEFSHAFSQHYVRGLDSEAKPTVHMCLRNTYEKDCPICTALQDAILSATSDEMRKLLAESKASTRFLVNALRIDGSEPKKPVILEMSSTTFRDFSNLFEQYINPPEDSGDEPVDIMDLESGFDITITRTGKGLGTKYVIAPAIKSTKISETVLADLHDLDEYVRQEFLRQERSSAEQKATAVLHSVISGKLPSPSSNKLSAADYGADDDILEGDYEEEKFSGKTSKAPSDEEIDDILGDLADLDL